MEEYTKEECDELNALLESHLFGTKTLRDVYASMTPGEPEYHGMDKETELNHHSREGEETPKKSFSEVVKKVQESLGPDLDTEKNSPAPPGGIGETKSFSSIKNRLSGTNKYIQDEVSTEAPPVTGFAKQTT